MSFTADLGESPPPNSPASHKRSFLLPGLLGGAEMAQSQEMPSYIFESVYICCGERHLHQRGLGV